MNTEITFPVASILENTEAIVNACEDMELSARYSSMSPSPSPLSPPSSSTAAAPSNSSQEFSIILVTELAALLHLQQYDHARHLWRRYAAATESSPSDDVDAQSASSSTSTFLQFSLLWRAVAPLLHAHSQEIHSTNTDAVAATVTAADIHRSNNIAQTYTSLQQTCIERTPKLEPLATYATQLQSSLRNTLVQTIERSFESIHVERCNSLLGLSSSSGGKEEDLEDFLRGRKWTKEMGSEDIWIPPCCESPIGYSGDGAGGNAVGSSDSRVDYLTNIVGFMETQRFNA